MAYLAVDLVILFPFVAKMRDPKLGFSKHRQSIIASTLVVPADFEMLVVAVK
ncbi:MAG: hypothetical protein M1469_09645 [Bacteroidetes bacterium]|nr:hypothetical protein [Bacteroidota bacterium]MCL5268350.1 hypothetical protein [Bacteroidota bacterium]